MAETPAMPNKPDLVIAAASLEEALATFRRALKAHGFATPGSPLFQALRAWRTEVARTAEMPPYIIASDAVLHAIEDAKPKSLAELADVKGLGASKIANYGPAIVEIVAQAA